MSFKGLFTKLTKNQLIDVATSHVDLVLQVDASFKQALLDVGTATDDETKLEILTQIIKNAFGKDLLKRLLAESQALVKASRTKASTAEAATLTTTKTSIGTTSTPLTSGTAPVTAIVVSPKTVKPDSDDEEEDPRRSKAYKLPPNIPMFMAEGLTCDEWFFVFENALSSNSIPNHVVLPILSTFLKGTALHLLKNFMDSGKTDWYTFKDLLRTMFLPKDHAYRLRVQLTKLTQHNDAIDAYNRKFLAISTQLTELTHADRLFYYTLGLHNRTRYEVLSKQPKTLDEALAIATQFNHINNHAAVGDIDVKKIKFKRNNNRGIQGPQLKPEPVKAKPIVTCYKCNRQGHYSNDCRSTASSTPTVPTDRSTNRRWTVKSRPHYKKALTFKHSDVDTLLQVEGSITGTNQSLVISEVMARHYDFSIVPSDIGKK